METPNYLSGLNERQKDAVMHTSGPVLVVAGAGAGKTKTITARIVHLIHQGVAPRNILAITFTNKAAAEMRDRVAVALSGERLEAMPTVCTFHSLCVRILREFSHLVGRTKHFGILDEDDAVKLVKESIIEAGLDPKQYEPKKFKHMISRAKGNFITLSKYEERAESYVEKNVANVWRRYEEKLRKEQAFDFDDLLLETVILIEKNAEVKKILTERYIYLHVDEYQDTNEVQYALTKLLAEKEKNICVVGDTDQNIYGWRGAQIKNMIHFEKDFPGAHVVFLEQNYRSTKTILAAANQVILKNTVRVPKELFTNNDDGEPISMYESYDERDEAEFVAERTRSLIDEGVLPEKIAVLYRANFQSRVLEEAFIDAGLPYQVLGVKFYDRKEVKDVLSYVKAALNRESLTDIKRIINLPPRGIGKTTLVKLFSGMQTELPSAMQKKIAGFYEILGSIKEDILTLPTSTALRAVVQKTGIEAHLKNGTAEDLERLENIQELVTLATKYDLLPLGEGIEKMLEDAALASDQDSLLIEKKEKQNGVRLMTVHAAKGLEFAHVFVVGLEQDLFPHQRRGESTTEDREEERRLFYVALTRAEKKLFLSYATVRTIFGMRQVNTPSEFLHDIPAHLTMQELRQTSSGPTKIIYLD